MSKLIGILNKLTVLLGMVLAPIVYIAGRLLSVKVLRDLSAKLDPQNIRFLSAAINTNQSRSPIDHFGIAAMLASKANYETANKIKYLLPISESQLLQDVFCALALNEKRNGFFVEVGVGSGRAISNTYMLEKHYGWNGLLVEPNRSSHESIAECRSARLEKRAAASKSGETLNFEELIDAGEHSRIVGTGGHTMPGARRTVYEVQTITLTEILDQNNAPKEIDFLSLDTEGSELDILRGVDFGKYEFSIIVVEHNYNKKTMNSLNEILCNQGYALVLPEISQFDAWYINKKINIESFFL